MAAFSVTAGSKLWEARVDGAAYSLAVADGGLLVSTDTGAVHCFRAVGTSPSAAAVQAAAQAAIAAAAAQRAEIRIIPCAPPSRQLSVGAPPRGSRGGRTGSASSSCLHFAQRWRRSAAAPGSLESAVAAAAAPICAGVSEERGASLASSVNGSVS